MADTAVVRTSYDQLMKQVLQARFADFLRLFAPTIAAGLDLDAGPTFRDTETFIDLPRGTLLIPDIVAEVRTLAGDPDLVAVHVEVQKEREREDFARRMWRYFIALAMREDKPIIAIALLFYPTADGLAWEVYEETLFGQTTVTFRYLQISLPRLDPESYLRTGNALASALASVMGRRRRGAARARLYVTCLQQLLAAEASGDVDGATADLLADVVETYLPIRVEDRAALRVQLAREGGNETVMEATQLTWRSRVSLEVAEEVTQRVTQEVTLQTKREDIKELIQGRFGAVSPEMAALIDGADSVDDLNALFRRAITAQTESDLLRLPRRGVAGSHRGTSEK
jgi:hypothetical protein